MEEKTLEEDVDGNAPQPLDNTIGQNQPSGGPNCGPTVDEMYIEYDTHTQYHSLDHFSAFLNIITEIGMLEVADYDWGEGRHLNGRNAMRAMLDELGDSVLTQTRVRGFCFHETTGWVVMELLRRGLGVRPLETIKVDCVDMEQFAVLCDLLHTCRDSVRSLWLDVPSLFNDDDLR